MFIGICSSLLCGLLLTLANWAWVDCGRDRERLSLLGDELGDDSLKKLRSSERASFWYGWLFMVLAYIFLMFGLDAFEQTNEIEASPPTQKVSHDL